MLKKIQGHLNYLRKTLNMKESDRDVMQNLYCKLFCVVKEIVILLL
jgi:hypothetical protein